MANEIFYLQFVFYVLILFILAVTLKGWWGFMAGIAGGCIILFVLFISISGSENTFGDRGR